MPLEDPIAIFSDLFERAARVLASIRSGAWASQQSATLASRELLDQRVREARDRFEGGAVPRPPYWTGFRVVADSIEFWTRDPARLHERIVFKRHHGNWARTLLFP